MKWKRIAAAVLAMSMLPCTMLSASAVSFSHLRHTWGIDSTDPRIPHIDDIRKALTPEDYAVLTASLDNTERAAAEHGISKFNDAEYGMAAVSLLSAHGLLPFGEYDGAGEASTSNLHNLVQNAGGVNDKIISLIYYYTALEGSRAMQQYIANQKITTDSTQRLQLLVEQVEAGTPSIVTIDWAYTALAHSVKYGSYEYNGRTYDGKLVVYHPKFDAGGVEANDIAIYFSTEDWSWFVPHGSKCPENGSSIQYFCGDIDIINSGGLHQGTQVQPESDFVSILDGSFWTDAMKNGLSDCTISAVDAADGGYTLRGTAPEGGLIDGRTDYYYAESTAGLSISHEEIFRFSGGMHYDGMSCYLDAMTANGFLFHPSGYVEMNGIDSSYTFEMVFDEGEYSGSWHTIEVSGVADTASLERTEAGYVLHSDNLTNIIASGSGRGCYAPLVFSADADTVLLYEIDSSTLGAAIDTDGDGTYETPIAATGSPSSGTFLMGRNNWYFPNSTSVFGSDYYFLPDDREALEATLSNIELYQAGELLNDEFKGSCYGMAVLSLLSCYDLIDYGEYRVHNTIDRQGEAISLFDIGDITPETKSLINYYSMLQYTDEIWQYIVHDMNSRSDTARLQEAIDNAEAGIPTLLAYYQPFNAEGNRSGHAVVAYDVEYGDYEVQLPIVNEYGYDDSITVRMDGRLVLYDNAAQHTPNTVSYLYFNTTSKEWIRGSFSSKDGATLCMAVSDPNLLNANGMLEGTSYTGSEDFTAILFTNPLSSAHTVEEITYDAGVWETAASTDTEIRAFPVFLANGKSGNAQNFTMTSPDSGYVLTAEKTGKMALEMQYENILFTVDADSASQAVFHPEGYAEISGDTAPYTLAMIMNDGTYAGSWYDFKVSGIGGNASLRRTEEGYILTADDLTDVTAEAIGHTADASLTFTAYTDSVLLYEVDAETIGVKADTDGDGIYETPADELPEPSLGDVNADGRVDASDAAALLTAAAAAGTGTEDVLDAAAQLRADVNADGAYNASDAAILLQYAAAAGTGSTLTLEEFIASLT